MVFVHMGSQTIAPWLQNPFGGALQPGPGSPSQQCQSWSLLQAQGFTSPLWLPGLLPPFCMTLEDTFPLGLANSIF